MNEISEFLAAEQDRMQRLTRRETLLAPYRDEQGLTADDGFVQPLGILAAMPRTVDKRACKDVMPVHEALPEALHGRNTLPAPELMREFDDKMVSGPQRRQTWAQRQCYRINRVLKSIGRSRERINTLLMVKRGND
jgi:hypothetical protein